MRSRPALALLGLLVLASAGLAGCGDALTVHQVVSTRDAAPDVPAVSGQWIVRGDGGEPGVLRIEGEDAAGTRCRAVRVTYVEAGQDDIELGDELCFAEFNGHLVVELRSVAEPHFYRQYLVRITEDRIEACGAHPIWLMFKWLAEDRPTGYSLDELKHTVRTKGDKDLVVVVSEPKEMRAFLETNLPELASACDGSDEDMFQWFRFEKMSPEEEAKAVATAASD